MEVDGLPLHRGDADGQFEPIFDRWQDAMAKKDFRTSQFLHEMCGGLRVKLTTYRRGADEALFRWYTKLYKHADAHKLEDRWDFSDVRDTVVEQTRRQYAWKGEEIDHYFPMSHVQRIRINKLMNSRLAARHGDTLFLPSPGKMHGVALQPQDMRIWRGLELLCYARKYAAKSPVTGCVYVVEDFDDTFVTVRLHEDYRPKFNVKPAPEEEPELDENGEEETPSEPDDMEADDDDAPAKDAVEGKEGVYRLTHAKAARILRLQHALVYASIQGRTMRQKHICLLNTSHEHFTVRHLIVATSRATHGLYVHVASAEQEEQLLSEATG